MFAIIIMQDLSFTSLLSKTIKIKIYRNIILPVLCGCETWSLTLREKRRQKVTENRVLRIIVGPKRGEVTVEWRTLHKEETNDLNASPNSWVVQSRRMMCGACDTYGRH